MDVGAHNSSLSFFTWRSGTASGSSAKGKYLKFLVTLLKLKKNRLRITLAFVANDQFVPLLQTWVCYCPLPRVGTTHYPLPGFFCFFLVGLSTKNPLWVFLQNVSCFSTFFSQSKFRFSLWCGTPCVNVSAHHSAHHWHALCTLHWSVLEVKIQNLVSAPWSRIPTRLHLQASGPRSDGVGLPLGAHSGVQ